MTSSQKQRGGLARCLNTPDGIDPRTALLRAAREVENHREEALKRIHESVAAIIDMAPKGAAVRAEMAVCATEIAGVSGVFSLMPLGRAATSLSDILALLNDDGPWMQDWVDVHVRALRVLSGDAPRAPEQEEAILTGLKDVLSFATQRRGSAPTENTP